jgi:hypothetical protein
VSKSGDMGNLLQSGLKMGNLNWLMGIVECFSLVSFLLIDSFFKGFHPVIFHKYFLAFC